MGRGLVSGVKTYVDGVAAEIFGEGSLAYLANDFVQ
jgi:hypothetical protein